MKLWKKMACAAFCLVLAFGTFTACDVLPDDSAGAGSGTQSSTDSGSGNETTDSGSGNESTDGGSGNESTDGGSGDEVKAVKTVKAEGVMEFSNVAKYFAEGTEEFDPEQIYAYDGTASFVLEVSLEEDGDVAAHFRAEAPYKMGSDGVVKEYTGVSELIIKDEVLYEREYSFLADGSEDEVLETDTALWDIVEIEVEPEVLEVMALLEKVIATDEAQDYLTEIALLCQQIVDEEIIPSIPESGEISLEYDFAPDISAVIEAIEAIDEMTTTVGDIIDGVLVQIDPQLNAEAVLALVASYKDYTVGEALTDIDLALAEYDTSLQDIYDNIVKSEIVEVILTDELVGMSAEELAAMREFKIATIAQEYGAITFGDLVNLVLEESGAVDVDSEVTEPVDYFAEYLAMAEQMLDMTLADLGVIIPEIPVKFNKLEIVANAQFDETLASIVENVSIVVNIDFENKLYEEVTDSETGTAVELYVGVQYTTASFSFNVDILDEAVAIEAPAADKIYSAEGK